MDEHWKFILDNEKELRNLCRIMCSHRYDLQDEAFSQVCFRMPQIFSTFDVRIGASIKTHAFKNARWYLWKWLRGPHVRRPKQEAEWESLPDEVPEEIIDLDLPMEVQQIMDRLSEYDRTLLLLYHVHSYTFQEIADYLDVVKGTARNHYLAALKRAREIANELHEELED